jgi:hypothetical protein
MKTVVTVMLSNFMLPEGAQTVLGPAGCGPDVVEVKEELAPLLDVWVTLEATDPRLPVLFQLLKQHKVSCVEIHREVYTEEELSSARLLLMEPTGEAEVSGGVEYGMTYDLSGACPACGRGGQQTSTAFIDAKDLGKLEGQRAGAIIFSHVLVVLVDAGLEAELVRIGATGISFREVYAVWPDKRTLKLPFQQLCAARTLPPMSPSTTELIRNRACEVCGRSGYFKNIEAPIRVKESLRVVYQASDVRDADDVNMSWEDIGGAVIEPRDDLLSYPWMVVTPKVRRVFRDAGVTCFDWLPVRVEEG